MTKDYEGKLGFGQLFFCLLAAATLFIPYALEPSINFSFNNIMPIANSVITSTQATYVGSFLTGTVGLSGTIMEIINTIVPYSVYIFYGIIAFDLLFTLILMILRNEIVRQIVRLLSVLLGFVMLIASIFLIVTVVGFFTYYLNNGFGEGKAIFDCIKNNGLLFFAGIAVFSFIGTIKQFSSFFGKSY